MQLLLYSVPWSSACFYGFAIIINSCSRGWRCIWWWRVSGTCLAFRFGSIWSFCCILHYYIYISISIYMYYICIIYIYVFIYSCSKNLSLRISLLKLYDSIFNNFHANCLKVDYSIMYLCCRSWIWIDIIFFWILLIILLIYESDI